MQIFNSFDQLQTHFKDLAPKTIRDHSLAVARGCQDCAQARGIPKEPLFLAGLLHDIGKSPDLHATGFHPLDGARWLHALGEKDLAYLVARHSTSVQEAHLLHIHLERWATEKFPKEQVVLDAVDLTTNSNGKRVRFEDRLRDISSRYPLDSPEVQSLRMLRSAQRASISQWEDEAGLSF